MLLDATLWMKTYSYQWAKKQTKKKQLMEKIFPRVFNDLRKQDASAQTSGQKYQLTMVWTDWINVAY